MNGPSARVTFHSLRVNEHSVSAESRSHIMSLYSLSVSVSKLLQYRPYCLSVLILHHLLFIYDSYEHLISR